MKDDKDRNQELTSSYAQQRGHNFDPKASHCARKNEGKAFKDRSGVGTCTVAQKKCLGHPLAPLYRETRPAAGYGCHSCLLRCSIFALVSCSKPSSLRSAGRFALPGAAPAGGTKHCRIRRGERNGLAVIASRFTGGGHPRSPEAHSLTSQAESPLPGPRVSLARSHSLRLAAHRPQSTTPPQAGVDGAQFVQSA